VAPLDFPPSPIAPPLATVLPRGLHPMAAMGTNQLNAPLRQALSPWVRVPGLLVDHTLRLWRGRPGPWRGTAMGSRVGSNSVTSAGEAASKRFPKGRPWPSTTTSPFVPLPRVVLPTQAPRFSPGQSCRQPRFPPHRVGLGRPVAPRTRATPSATRLGLPSPGGAASRYWGTETAPARLAIGHRFAGPRGGLRRQADAGWVSGRRLARP
jgi:hypothetical protein